MGLLDDAIREHLELKRLRGADPGDVAREEDAALGPVHRPAESESESPREDRTETAASAESQAAHAPSPSESSTGQETVEINMEAELAGLDPERAGPKSAPQDAPVAHPVHGTAFSGESLEWEMPGDPRVDPDTAYGEGRESEGDPGSDLTQGLEEEPVEDVLEETPDFLRDTPEQERLWFEQRPPRDFDFNE